MSDIIMQKFNTAKRIAVFSHIRPDADAFGSALALYAALTKQGKEVGLFVDDVLPSKFIFLKHYNLYNTKELKDFDLLIACDCSDLERLGQYASDFRKHKNTINIDHHKTNTRFGEINHVMPAYASTCEIILEILENCNVKLNFDIALPLYCGMSTDTGNFMYSNTNERTFLSAYKLIKYIKDISPYIYELYKKTSVNRTKLLGHVLGNIKMYCDNKLAILVIRNKDLVEFDVPSYESEGFVDYAINIDTVQIGICMLESSEKSFKISMRSREKDVAIICDHFGGGGHKFAAGCKLDGYFEDVLEKLVKTVGLTIS